MKLFLFVTLLAVSTSASTIGQRNQHRKDEKINTGVMSAQSVPLCTEIPEWYMILHSPVCGLEFIFPVSASGFSEKSGDEMVDDNRGKNVGPPCNTLPGWPNFSDQGMVECSLTDVTRNLLEIVRDSGKHAIENISQESITSRL